MTSPIIVRSGNQLLYQALYTSAWRTGIWLPEQDWALSKDPEVWEKVRRDPVVEHAISSRLHNIAAREWRVMPGGEDDASQRLAELIESALEEIEGLTSSQYQLAQAVMLGRSYGYMEGRRQEREIEGVGTVELWMPTRIVPIDRRRIRFLPITGRTPDGRSKWEKTVVEIGTFDPGVWRPVTDEQWRYFIKVVFDDDESRLGYGRGLLGAVYFYHYAKGVTLREGLKGVERWAQGLKVIKVDPDRPGSSGKTNEQIKQDYLTEIEKNMARNTLVMEKGDEFEAMWPSGSGHQLVMDMCRYLDQGVTQLILGSVLPTGGGDGGGSYARASVEEDASERLVIYDRRILDDAITRDLIGLFMRVNKAQLHQIGLGKAKPPKIRSVNDKKQDPQIASQIAQTLLAAGIPLRRDEVYEKTGFTPPKPGEEIIEGTKPQEPGMGGLPGFGGGPGDGPPPPSDRPPEGPRGDEEPDPSPEPEAPEEPESEELEEAYVGPRTALLKRGDVRRSPRKCELAKQAQSAARTMAQALRPKRRK